MKLRKKKEESPTVDDQLSVIWERYDRALQESNRRIERLIAEHRTPIEHFEIQQYASHPDDRLTPFWLGIGAGVAEEEAMFDLGRMKNILINLRKQHPDRIYRLMGVVVIDVP